MKLLMPLSQTRKREESPYNRPYNYGTKSDSGSPFRRVDLQRVEDLGTRVVRVSV